MRAIGRVAQTMSAIIHVKKRFRAAALSLALLAASHLFAAPEATPDALAILRAVRIAQTSQHTTLVGDLRTGAQSLPFRLVIDGPTLRYEFTNPSLALVLHLGEKGSQLQEVTHSGVEKVTAARFDAKVRGTDISYEDLALRFLYWPGATYLGQDTRNFRRCWKVQAEPGDTESQYSRVVLWVEQESGALLKAEAYDKAGKLDRRFTVISVQKTDNVWILKQMRIEVLSGKEQAPTYLEITGSEK